MKIKTLLLFPVAAAIACAQTALKEIELGTLGQGGSWAVNLGAEFPGAQGGLTAKVEAGRAVGVVNFDFSAGGNYVAAVSKVDVPAGYSELRLKVKSDNAGRLALRLRDASGQYHQFGLSHAGGGEWQSLRQPLTLGKSPLYFQGAADGIIHFPITQLWLLVNRPAGEVKSGELVFSDVRALP